MKTTLILADATVRRLKSEASKRGCTMSQIVEAALQAELDPTPKEKAPLSRLPKFSGGGELVDISDREELYRAMDGQ